MALIPWYLTNLLYNYLVGVKNNSDYLAPWRNLVGRGVDIKVIRNKRSINSKPAK